MTNCQFGCTEFYDLLKLGLGRNCRTHTHHKCAASVSYGLGSWSQELLDPRIGINSRYEWYTPVTSHWSSLSLESCLQSK